MTRDGEPNENGDESYALRKMREDLEANKEAYIAMGRVDIDDDRLPIGERPKVRYRCSGCGLGFSMYYLRRDGEESHNRPFCETCRVPMEPVDVDDE